MEEELVIVAIVRNGNKRMKKIAVTGSIGSGKSYIIRCIKAYGVFVLDLDEVAKIVRKEQESVLIDHFHVSDKKGLAQLVFSDAKKREQLENMLYPMMIEKMKRFFQLHESEKLVVCEVPLLFEKGWECYFDEVWCVYCDQNTCFQRLIQNRNMKTEEIKARLSMQMSAEEKRDRSDKIIYNNEDDNVEEQIKKILAEEEFDDQKRK